MSSEEFTKLKRLLVCKRYEQPPPGFFDRFSDRVVARIEADDNNELPEYSSWWQWLVNKFDAKPVVACVYGLTVSGLLLAGFRISEAFENEVAASGIHPLPWLATTPASPLLFPVDAQGNYFDPNSSPIPSAVNPIFGADTSHFPAMGESLSVQPVGFSFQPSH